MQEQLKIIVVMHGIDHRHWPRCYQNTIHRLEYKARSILRVFPLLDLFPNNRIKRAKKRSTETMKEVHRNDDNIMKVKPVV